MNIRVAADVAQAIAALSKAGRAVNKLGDTSHRSNTRARGLAHTVGKGFKVAGLASIPVLGLLAYQTHAWVTAAADAEVKQTKLRTQLKASKISWAAHRKEIQDNLATLQDLSAFDDDDLAVSLANLVRATGNVNQAMRLNALVVDIARAKGMDLETVSKAVSKAAAGQTGALSRLGVKVRKGVSAQQALTEAQRQFHGQAAAYGKTSSGALEKLNVVWENIQETLGQALLPTVKKLADRFSTWLKEAQKSGQIRRIVKRIQGALEDAGTAVVTVYNWFLAVKNVVETVVDRVEQLRDAINSLPGVGGGGIGGILSNVVPGGGLLFGGKAAGGPVAGGRGYIVGEQGPEFFVPRQSGTIIPNHALGGQQIVVNVNGGTLSNPAVFALQVAHEWRRRSPLASRA